ncbi:WYL domain-containing protein [Ornithobacterium rhinotracheale]|uniref:helix-turn-helix transcriptional regulator n=1 Tax=Ornithobacterium rhinotracheale TaxID=28251 RepID=UPI00129CEB9B|nr:WYL domain-containing protein [Ornithobacterium rhinotracheale]MRI62729.1 WYL domain-containing protein [Ornithobacterium rhinotracheale]
MAQNKNAQLRYKALDQCFSNYYKRFYLQDLIDYCSEKLSEHYARGMSVSRRQIYDDIDFMRSEAGFSAPIEAFKEGRKVYYRYTDKDFSILKKPLSVSEENHLREAIEIIARLSNVQGFDWLEGLQTKLNASLGKTNTQVISFQENEFLKGIHFLNPLYQYIVNQQVLAIKYQSFKKVEIQDLVLSPYYLKQFNNRWFLFAWNHEWEILQNLALDRILDIQPVDEVFRENTIDFAEYFEDIVGVTNLENELVERVEIELSDYILPYIQTKPLHGSQRIKGNLLSMEVKINFEFIALILSFGQNMRVKSPDSLVGKIKAIVCEMAKNYACTSTA